MDTWSPYPAVNLPELDAEHRALGVAVREMLGAMTQDDRERTLVLAGELAGKVEKHFVHEEQLMRKLGYPHEARHARTHAQFMAEARRHIEIVRERGLSAEVLRWAGQLDEWFHRHVLTEDMLLAFAVNRTREAQQTPHSK